MYYYIKVGGKNIVKKNYKQAGQKFQKDRVMLNYAICPSPVRSFKIYRTSAEWLMHTFIKLNIYLYSSADISSETFGRYC